jgi:hypothetical protein
MRRSQVHLSGCLGRGYERIIRKIFHVGGLQRDASALNHGFDIELKLGPNPKISSAEEAYVQI